MVLFQFWLVLISWKHLWKKSFLIWNSYIKMHLQWRMRHCQTELARSRCEPVYWKLPLLHGFYWSEETGPAFTHGLILVQQFLSFVSPKDSFWGLIYGYISTATNQWVLYGRHYWQWGIGFLNWQTTTAVNTEVQSLNRPAAHEEICRLQASGKDTCSKWHGLLEASAISSECFRPSLSYQAAKQVLRTISSTVSWGLCCISPAAANVGIHPVFHIS